MTNHSNHSLGPIVSLLLLVLLVSAAYRGVYFRVLIRKIFRDAQPAWKVDWIQETLAAINNESSKCQFSPLRVLEVEVRGMRFTLVDGNVGYNTFGKTDVHWTLTRSVFVVAESESAQWLERNADIFRLAFEGTTHSVFVADK